MLGGRRFKSLVWCVLSFVLLGVAAVSAFAVVGQMRVSETALLVESLSALLDEYHVSETAKIGRYPNVGDFDAMDTEQILIACKPRRTTHPHIESMGRFIEQRQAGEVVSYHGQSVTLQADARFVKDSWGNYLWYRPNAAPVNTPLHELARMKGEFVSSGADGVFGTEDDIEPGLDKR